MFNSSDETDGPGGGSSRSRGLTSPGGPGSILHTAALNARRAMNYVPVDENAHNARIQQAVNRYNGTLPPYCRSSAAYKCSMLKLKSMKAGALQGNDETREALRHDPETRYPGAGPGHMPVVILKKGSPPKEKQSILSRLRTGVAGLPHSRYLDDTNEKYSEYKTTRSVLEVLHDLSRKRIHGKDDTEESSKRRCKGLAGDLSADGEVPYRPLFLPKPKSSYTNRDQTTQTISEPIREIAPSIPVDKRTELRKKLAKKNNDILASLSSSINLGSLFSKRKRESAKIQSPEAPNREEEVVTKRQKIAEVGLVETPKPQNNKDSGASVHASPKTPPTLARSPPTKDKLMRMYWSLEDSTDMKRRVLESLKDNPGERQFHNPKSLAVSSASTPPTFLSSVTVSSGALSTSPIMSNTVGNTPSPSATDPPMVNNTSTGATAATPVLTPTLNFSTGGEQTSPVPKSILLSDLSKSPLSSKPKKSVTFPTDNKVEEVKAASSVESPKSNPSDSAPFPSFTFGTSSAPTVSTSGGGASFSFGLGSKSATLVPPTSNAASLGASLAAKVSPAVSSPDPAVSKAPMFSFGVSASPATEIKPSSTTPAPAFSFGVSEKAPDSAKTSTVPEKTGLFSLTTTKSPLGSVSLPKNSDNSPAPNFTFGSSNKDQQKEKPAAFVFGTLSTVDVPAPKNEKQEKVPTFGLGQSTFGSNTLSNKDLVSTEKPEEKVTFVSKENAVGLFPSVNKPNSSVNEGGIQFGNKSSVFSRLGTKSGEPKPSEETSAILAAKPLATSGNSLFSLTPSQTPASSGFGTNVPTTDKKSEVDSLKTSTPAFSFGQTKPTAFGSPSVSTTTAPSSFTFGLAPATTASAAKSTTGFSFGQGPPSFGFVSSGATGGSTTPNTFAFGQSSTTSTTTSGASTTPNAFAFGQPASSSNAPTSGVSTAPSTFAFGQSVPSTASNTTSSSTAPGTFSFGQPVSAPAPATTASSGNTFAFGQSSTATPTTTTSSTFSFGSSSNAFTFGKTTTASQPNFSLGGSTTCSAGSLFGNQVGKANEKPAASTLAPMAFGASEPNKPTFGSGSVAFGAGSAATNTSASLPQSVPSFGGGSKFTFGTSTPPTFGTPTTTAVAFGGTNSSPKFGVAATTAPSPLGSSIFGSSTAPSFSTGSSFGNAPTTTAGFSMTAPAFGAKTATAFGASPSSTFGSKVAPAFGSSQPPAFNFGAKSTTTTPGFGEPATNTSSTFGGFNSSTPAFGATSASTPGFGASPGPNVTFGAQNTSTTSGFGSAPASAPSFGSSFGATSTGAFGSSTPSSSAPTANAPFAFGSSNNSFNFSSSANNNQPAAPAPAPFAFGSTGSASATPSPSPVFNFGANSASSSGGAFAFGSSANQQPTPGPSGTQPFGAPAPFSVPGTFSIGSGSTQPRSRTASRLRRKP